MKKRTICATEEVFDDMTEVAEEFGLNRSAYLRFLHFFFKRLTEKMEITSDEIVQALEREEKRKGGPHAGKTNF